MASGVADFGQCSTTGQGVADEGMPAAVDSEYLKPSLAEDSAGGAKSLTQGMT